MYQSQLLWRPTPDCLTIKEAEAAVAPNVPFAFTYINLHLAKALCVVTDIRTINLSAVAESGCVVTAQPLCACAVHSHVTVSFVTTYIRSLLCKVVDKF